MQPLSLWKISTETEVAKNWIITCCWGLWCICVLLVIPNTYCTVEMSWSHTTTYHAEDCSLVHRDTSAHPEKLLWSPHSYSVWRGRNKRKLVWPQNYWAGSLQLNQSIECSSEAWLWGLMSFPALISYGFEPAVNAQFRGLSLMFGILLVSLVILLQCGAHYLFNQFRSDGEVFALVPHKVEPSVRLVSLSLFENKTSVDTFYHSLLLLSNVCEKS